MPHEIKPFVYIVQRFYPVLLLTITVPIRVPSRELTVTFSDASRARHAYRPFFSFYLGAI